MVKFIILLLCLLFLFCNCTTVKHKSLTYKNTYSLREGLIRTDGYFYESNQRDLIEIYVFFPDGYLYQGFFRSHAEIQSRLQKKNVDQDKIGWGVYRIDGDTIKLQYFTPLGNELQAVWEVIEEQGRVVNSEKIQLYKSQVRNSVYIFSRTYSFVRQDTMPSSKNWLMNLDNKKP